MTYKSLFAITQLLIISALYTALTRTSGMTYVFGHGLNISSNDGRNVQKSTPEFSWWPDDKSCLLNFEILADSESDDDMLATVTEMTNATWHVLLAALSLLLDAAKDEPALEITVARDAFINALLFVCYQKQAR